MSTPRLSDLFAQLQAERERSWPPAQLASNSAQRRALVAAHDPASQAQVGDSVPPFTLRDAAGARVTRDALLHDGPAVLLFFRFGSCPACNIALPHYDRTLWPILDRAGIPLVAISAQTPVDEGLVQRHDLRLPVLTDPDYALARALGITFFPADRPTIAPGQDWIGATLGTQSWEMIKPAALVIEPDATIRFIDVSPDWLARTEPDALLAHLPEVRQEAARR